MALNTKTSLGAHQFDGPHTKIDTLPSVSGVYLITTLTSNQQHLVIDAGESHDIKNRISSHDRANQWQQHQQSGLYAWVFAASEVQRMIIEKAHRLAYSPVCGEQ